MSDQFAAIYRRRPNEGWFRAGRYDVTTTDIVCGLAVVSMFVYGFGIEYFAKLIFVPALVRDFEFEVIDLVDQSDASDLDIAAELEGLEAVWRDELGIVGSSSY
jgi:hypothetical protein